jgi:hypothetical protein
MVTTEIATEFLRLCFRLLDICIIFCKRLYDVTTVIFFGYGGVRERNPE